MKQGFTGLGGCRVHDTIWKSSPIAHTTWEKGNGGTWSVPHDRTPVRTESQMKRLRVPLRIVVYQEDGDWVAHCLEFDLVGAGSNRKEAMSLLAEAVSIQAEESFKSGNLRNLFSPADGKYFQMFFAGKDICEGNLQIVLTGLDSVEIGQQEAREYSDGDLVTA